MKRFYLLILLTSLLSCQEQPKQKPDFLIGDWTRNNNKPGEQTYEMWKEDFTGLGFTLTSQDTTFKEVLSIISIKDTLYLQVEGVNEKPTLFKFIEQTDSSFTCVNPNNEFPKKITYFKDHNQLKAIVANDDFQLDFVFSKN
ncbi:MAG: hypothetical protein CMB99_06325 [Flavobacteriaceae bacterium]|nr:hypothetical protein [Flavobacteriaceae bacterium]|tara:strand:- start:36326 stop:36751 length:426 start_codon:yes stop_codon:yes gene_type:complete